MPDLPQLPDTPALRFGKRLVTQSMADEVFDLAAGLAYRFLFAIFPFAIFLAALAAYVAGWLGLGDPTDQIMGAVARQPAAGHRRASWRPSCRRSSARRGPAC